MQAHLSGMLLIVSLLPRRPLQAWYTGEGALGSLSKFANGF